MSWNALRKPPISWIVGCLALAASGCENIQSVYCSLHLLAPKKASINQISQQSLALFWIFCEHAHQMRTKEASCSPWSLTTCWPLGKPNSLHWFAPTLMPQATNRSPFLLKLQEPFRASQARKTVDATLWPNNFNPLSTPACNVHKMNKHQSLGVHLNVLWMSPQPNPRVASLGPLIQQVSLRHL